MKIYLLNKIEKGIFGITHFFDKYHEDILILVLLLIISYNLK